MKTLFVKAGDPDQEVTFPGGGSGSITGQTLGISKSWENGVITREPVDTSIITRKPLIP